ncbi:MAG: hypothetical protein WC767_00140 [Candidatus Paceibacterota bacterium]|jgi:D-alanyl-D-alanine carboxypeptidase
MNDRIRTALYRAGIIIAMLAAITLVTSLSNGEDGMSAVTIEAVASPAADAFPAVEIEARAAYVYDMKEGKSLYEKDSEQQLPLASLTKLMSAYVAATSAPDYLLVRITPADIRQEGDSGLRPDEEWNIRKLIDYSLVVSSNDGMSAIASATGAFIGEGGEAGAEDRFIRRMNETARSIGLSQTYFLNQSGLDVSDALSGGYGSARDIALLMNRILTEAPHLLEATSAKEITISSKDVAHEAENTNKSVASIPHVIASKTGYTGLSGGNLVIAFDAGIDHPIIISVLGSSYDGRFSDMQKLVSATLGYLSSQER